MRSSRPASGRALRPLLTLLLAACPYTTPAKYAVSTTNEARAADSTMTNAERRWPDAMRRNSRPGPVDGRLFDGTTWSAPPPKGRGKHEAEAPQVPAFPYTFSGRMTDASGATQVFLTRGEVIVAAKPGDLIDGQFRVDRVGASELTLTYTPLSRQVTVPFSAPPQQTAEGSSPGIRTSDVVGGSATFMEPVVPAAVPIPGAAPSGNGSGGNRATAAARVNGDGATTARANGAFPMLPPPSGTLTAQPPTEPFRSFPPADRGGAPAR
jgi:hypothetical protein